MQITACHSLEITGLSKRYENFALTEISLVLPSRSIVGLIGQNGAGKSTLIKSVLGLVKRDAGTIFLPGVSGHQTDEKIRQHIGYIPETLTFYEWMTVSRLVQFVSSYYQNWDDKYCGSLMARYELDARKLVKHLSKGMRAKLALLLALAHHPQLLILDEPTSGLDPVMKHHFLQELRSITDRGEARAVLISSHLLAEIESIADRVAVLREGSLVLYTETNKMLSRWRKVTFVAPRHEVTLLPTEWQVQFNGDGCRGLIVEEKDILQVTELLRRHGAQSINVVNPDLQEIFVKVAL